MSGEKDWRCDCWCYVIKKQVLIHGRVIGKRQADLLQVTYCEEHNCHEKNGESCLIGKIREGRWE